MKNRGFGQHETYEVPEGFYWEDGDNPVYEMMKPPKPSKCPGIKDFKKFNLKNQSKLLEDNFVKRFKKEMAERSCCSYENCQRLEDDEKFLNCGSCNKILSRKYCSRQCQINDWKTHKEVCKNLKTTEESSTPTPAYRTRQIKTKPKKRF